MLSDKNVFHGKGNDLVKTIINTDKVDGLAKRVFIASFCCLEKGVERFYLY